MLWWIVDNLSLVLLVLGIVALGFGAAWWTTRKNKLLIGVLAAALLMVLAWLLSLVIVTDRMQLVRNVEAMRDSVNAGKLDEAIQHFDETVIIDTNQGKLTFKRAELQALANTNMKRYGIKRIVVNKIDVEEVARPNAKVTFFMGPEDGAERGLCKMTFVLSPDGKWRVQAFSVETPIGGQKTPLVFPF